MDGEQQHLQSPPSSRKSRHRTVFLAPTRQQLESCCGEEPELTETVQRATVAWKVHHWRDRLRFESREHYQRCPETQPTSSCPQDCPYQLAIHKSDKRRHREYRKSNQGERAPTDDEKLSQQEPAGELSKAGADTEAEKIDFDNTPKKTRNETYSRGERPCKLTSEGALRNQTLSEVSRGADAPQPAHEEHIQTMEFIKPPLRQSSHATKKPRMVLGQARRVGISKTDRTRQQIHPNSTLIMLEAKRTAAAAEEEVDDEAIADVIPEEAKSSSTTSAIGRSQVSEQLRSISDRIGNESAWVSTTMGSSVTYESIAPPPAHMFVMANITPISRLLAFSNLFLSNLQGGDNVGQVPRFNILALVHRVGHLEKVKDWHARNGRMIDRCELVLCDAVGIALKVVLEGNCASRWAADTLHSGSTSNIKRPQGNTMRRNKTRATAQGWANDTSCEDSAIMLRQRDAALLFPVREGDVVVLSNLRLSKSNYKRRTQSNGWPCHAASSSAADAVYAVASSSVDFTASIELCWRSQVEQPHDASLNFDPAVGQFDARCRAILDLVAAWHVEDD